MKNSKKPNMMQYKVGEILVTKKTNTMYKDSDKSSVNIPIGSRFVVEYVKEYEYSDYYELRSLDNLDVNGAILATVYDDGEDGILQMYFKRTT